MSKFTSEEDAIIKKYIETESLITSLREIREAMMSIWSGEPIVECFTDHGEEHCKRLVKIVKNILSIKGSTSLSEIEVYLLLAGIYLHDIGMMCDVKKHKDLIKLAEDQGAKFDIEFTPRDESKCYTKEEQKAIRKNHHFLTAALIELARESNKNNHLVDTNLAKAVKSVKDKLLTDLMDICVYHSKSPLNDCKENLVFYPNERKKLVAALLRISDELDISENRVNFETIKYLSFDAENSVYWWIHHMTTVSFTGDYGNIICIKIGLNPNDMKCRNMIESIYKKNFTMKNEPVINILVHRGIPLSIDSNEMVIENKFIDELPRDVKEEIRKINETTKPTFKENKIKSIIKDIENTKDKLINLVDQESLSEHNYRFVTGEDFEKMVNERMMHSNEFKIKFIKNVSPSIQDVLVKCSYELGKFDPDVLEAERAFEMASVNTLGRIEMLNSLQKLETKLHIQHSTNS